MQADDCMSNVTFYAAQRTGIPPNSLKRNYQANITRAQFAELMVQTIELNGGELPKGAAFSDCSYDYVLKARAAGIVSGTGNNQFSPNASITRQQLVVMLMNAVKYMQQTGDYGGYYDPDNENKALFADVGDWAKNAVRAAYAQGMIQGNASGLNPNGNATCEQSIIMVWRAAQLCLGYDGQIAQDILALAPITKALAKRWDV